MACLHLTPTRQTGSTLSTGWSPLNDNVITRVGGMYEGERSVQSMIFWIFCAVSWHHCPVW